MILVRRRARAALAALLAFALTALAPGAAPYAAAAQIVEAAALGARVSASAVPVVALPATGLSVLPSAALLSPALSAPELSARSFSAAAAPAAPAAVAAPSAALAAAPAPVAAIASAVSAPAADPAATSLDAANAAGPRALGVLAAVAPASAAAAAPRVGLLDRLFDGARRAPSSAAAVTAAAPALSRASGLSAPSAYDSLSFLHDHSALESAEPPSPSPRGEDWIDGKAVAGMFLQRSVSIATFILTSLAYPLIAIHVVGPASFAVLMALGPLAAIATGPLNGFVADKLSPRSGLILLALVRGALAFALPALAWCGVMNFWTLLTASAANGWQLSLLSTSEGAYFRRLAGRNRISTITSLTSVNYMGLQVLMTLILGVGSLVDALNPMTPFLISTAIHFTVVPAILFFTLPKIAPGAAAAAGDAARTAGRKARELWDRARAAAVRHWKEIALFAASVGAYFAWGSPLPISLALMWWVSRTDGFRAVWTQKPLRMTMLLNALAIGLVFAVQNMAVPLMAGAIGGATGKGQVLGELLGALFFGQLAANASQARLPALKTPWGEVSSQALVQGGVLAMAGAWSFLRLFPGSWPAAGAAVAAGALLMAAGRRFSARGWARSLGVGLAAATVLPLVFWGHVPVVFAGLLLLGFFAGPTTVALSANFSRNADPATVGSAFGANSSLVSSTTSLVYGLMSVLIGTFHMGVPALFGPMAVVFAAVGVLFLFAPRLIPGLPGADAAKEKK